jgi:hypothetical protein
MNGVRRRIVFILLLHLWFSAAGGSSRADERDRTWDQDHGQDDPLSLADLAGYRAALSGRPTADDVQTTDPPVPVHFRDLWERASEFQGRRVTVRGRVERIFRQGPVGSFPPLAEVWIFSMAGDPLCLVFPLPESQDGGGRGRAVRASPPAGPDPGRSVRFTGTFLRMVRYQAADGARLAPLVVGDRPPQPAPAEAGRGESASSGIGKVLRALGGGHPDGATGPERGTWSLVLSLAILAAVVLAWLHLRGAGRRGRPTARSRLPDETMADPPLRFIDSADESPV